MHIKSMAEHRCWIQIRFQRDSFHKHIINIPVSADNSCAVALYWFRNEFTSLLALTKSSITAALWYSVADTELDSRDVNNLRFIKFTFIRTFSKLYIEIVFQNRFMSVKNTAVLNPCYLFLIKGQNLCMVFKHVVYNISMQPIMHLATLFGVIFLK